MKRNTLAHQKISLSWLASSRNITHVAYPYRPLWPINAED